MQRGEIASHNLASAPPIPRGRPHENVRDLGFGELIALSEELFCHLRGDAVSQPVVGQLLILRRRL